MSASRAVLPWIRVCYGVDVQAGKVVAVRAERRRGRIHIAPVAPPEGPGPDLAARRIPAVACLSARESITRWVEAPFGAMRKALRVLPTLLDIQLPFQLEECVYSFLHVARTRAGTIRALATAARYEDVRRRLDVLAALGVDPAALDQEGLALWSQSLKEVPAPAEPTELPRAVVSLSAESATLAIGRGARFVSAHGLRSVDAAQIARLLQAQLAGTGGGETGAEAKPAPAAIDWFWTGPAARNATLIADLQRQISREWKASFRTHDEPEIFLARAIATRALLPGPWRCNLRIGPFRHTLLAERERRQAAHAALLTLVSGLMLCAAGVTAMTAASQRQRLVAQTFVAQVDQLAGYHVAAKGEHALKIADGLAAQRREVLQPFVAAFEPSLLQIVLNAVEVAQRRGLRFDALAVTRDRIQISGSAQDGNGPDELCVFLRKAGFAARLQRQDALPDGRVPFAVASEESVGDEAGR